jgi:hypothetical protein
MSEENIIMRMAIRNDAARIMAAIAKYWGTNYMWAVNKALFLYSFAGDGSSLNFVIAEEKETNEIVGFLGFGKYSSAEKGDIYGELWFADKNKNFFLGVEEYFFLLEHSSALLVGAGVRPNTIALRKRMGDYVEKLNHFYRLLNKEKYAIAKVINKHIPLTAESSLDIALIDNYEQFTKVFPVFPMDDCRPAKDSGYIQHQYFAHPIFHYNIYAIVSKDGACYYSFFICREIEQFGVKILRIVDYLGPDTFFGDISNSIQKLMEKENYEYVEFYNYGIGEETMNKAGFIKRTDEDPNIIPSCFEPFLCQNSDIYFGATQELPNLRVCKGDGFDYPRLNNEEKK